jgi:O-antigen/teichoic acid export membrane protein
MKRLLFSILLISLVLIPGFNVATANNDKGNDKPAEVVGNVDETCKHHVNLAFVVSAIALVFLIIGIINKTSEDHHRRMYISPSDFDVKKVEEKPNKPKKKHMPRIFKFSIYAIIVLSLWKLYSHAEAIIIYFVTR